MRKLKSCTVCFTTDVKLFNMDVNSLRHQFNLLTGLQIKKANGMPEYLCYECTGHLKHFIKFRDKCHRAHLILLELLESEKEVKKSTLQEIDGALMKIKPNLSVLDKKNAHYMEIKYQWVKFSRSNMIISDMIPIVHYSTIPKEDIFEIETDSKLNVKDEIAKDITFEETAFEDIVEELPSNYSPDVMKSDVESVHSDGEMKNDEASDPNTNIANSLDVKNDKEADGSELDTEYATLVPLSKSDAKAAIEIYKTFSAGKLKCEICGKRFHRENEYKAHLRMHDTHVSGTHWCELCNYYYKTEFLLKSHITEKHMYKYLCKRCPEVSFDRRTAKKHYIFIHMQKGQKKKDDWEQDRPSWLKNTGMKGSKRFNPVGRKPLKLPADFLVYSPVGQKEQYEIVEKRKTTRNYLDSRYTCEMCYRGFREQNTYDKHMRKHNPEYAGKVQCDMCKLYFKDSRKLYRHMIITHIFKYTCQTCNFDCFNRSQAHMHYKWHKNVTYDCPHCDKIFKKSSTQLTHIRIKHPSTFICNLCGHSFVSESGLYCHKQISHTKEEIDAVADVATDDTASFFCSDCDIRFVNQVAFDIHLGSSNKHADTNLSINRSRSTPRGRAGRPRKDGGGGGSSEVLNNGVITATKCDICGQSLLNDVQARKHYEAEHPGAEFLKRYMCDVCGHTTKQYANLMVHMRIHTREKPYQCPHCDRRFSMPSNRDRHILVHTGEKRYECQHCYRRFSQSSALKLHVQTVHLKIPYAPWDKKNRKRRKQQEQNSAPVDIINPEMVLPNTTQKLVFEQGDYLTAYITYNE